MVELRHEARQLGIGQGGVMPDRREHARCRERVFKMADPSAGLVPGGRWPHTTHQSSTSSMRLRTRSAVMLLVFQIGSSTRWMSGVSIVATSMSPSTGKA